MKLSELSFLTDSMQYQGSCPCGDEWLPTHLALSYGQRTVVEIIMCSGQCGPGAVGFPPSSVVRRLAEEPLQG